MDQQDILRLVEEEMAGTLTVIASEESGAPEQAWGDVFFIYDPDRAIPPERQFPYATIVNSDYEGFDDLSDLDREGVFRVNIWVSSETFANVLGNVSDEVDFSLLDRFIPHPLYGKQSWVSVLNPGEVTQSMVPELLAEAYKRARERYEKAGSDS